jgi:hypothetical protein
MNRLPTPTSTKYQIAAFIKAHCRHHPPANLPHRETAGTGRRSSRGVAGAAIHKLRVFCRDNAIQLFSLRPSRRFMTRRS